MPLNIRPIQQPEGKPWCGLACAQMALAHYGIRRLQKTIAAALPMTEDGIRAGDLGRYLLQQGLGVAMLQWRRGTQPRLMGTCSAQELERALELRYTAGAGNYLRRKWVSEKHSSVRFSVGGGRFLLEPLQSRHIASALQKDWPVIVGVNKALLDRRHRSDLGHYVLPIRIAHPQRNMVHPWIEYIEPRSGTVIRERIDRFMHACHVWEGVGLIIHPKSVAKKELQSCLYGGE